jgi:hypothetical protein
MTKEKAALASDDRQAPAVFTPSRPRACTMRSPKGISPKHAQYAYPHSQPGCVHARVVRTSTEVYLRRIKILRGALRGETVNGLAKYVENQNAEASLVNLSGSGVIH